MVFEEAAERLGEHSVDEITEAVMAAYSEAGMSNEPDQAFNCLRRLIVSLLAAVILRPGDEHRMADYVEDCNFLLASLTQRASSFGEADGHVGPTFLNRKLI
jgi:hypothetical protein